MAIQFPNFLGVPINKADYSGIANAVDNFYSGYNMPKDALIKEIQAKFAQPTAEAELKKANLANEYQTLLNQFLPENQKQSLLSSKLSNRKAQLEIDKYLQDIAQQKALENQLKVALSGGSSAMPASTQNAMPSMQMTANQPLIQSGAKPSMALPDMQQTNQIPSANAANVANASAMPNMANAAPAPATAPMEMPNEVIVSKGSPHLSGIDMMYESNPLSRAFLEKKGYKKSQQIKFDNKTGRTTIITKWPSGKVTTQSSGGTPVSDEAPLTTANITKQQGIISSIDNTLPVIDEILKLDKSKKGNFEYEPYPRSSGVIPGLGWIPGYQSKSANYEAMVSSALDTLLGAYGLPKTNEGIETVKKQLLIGHGETDTAYKKRLQNLIEDLKRRRAYSQNLIKKSNKIQPVSSMPDYSDLNAFDNAGESE